MRPLNALLVLCLAAPTLAWTPASVSQETVGDKFRAVLADIDQRCRERKLGPYLDPSDPEYRRKVAVTSCDILKLEPQDWRTEKMVKVEGQPYPIPERWLETPEGRFAHSIKLPTPHDQRKELLQDGMGQQEYFEALCREEAGQWTFATIADVRSVFEARPRELVRNEVFDHLFYLEDPYGYVRGETRERIWGVYLGIGRYSAIERRVGPGGRIERLTGYDGRAGKPLTRTLEPVRQSRYGFVWRGTTRPQDREFGIAGGELLAYDVNSGAVLGFRRGFAVTSIGKRGASWEFAPVCPRQSFRNGRSKDFDFGLWFLTDVLQPPERELYRRELGAE